jgi:hypothetical protein
MAELKIKVNCRSMLISTAFFRFCKGVEHCYYALLFTSEPYTKAGAKPWLSWLEIGFHLAAREAPPDAAEADRLLIEARPGHNFDITASAANGKALMRLRDLLAELDRVRRPLSVAGEKDRLAAIVGDQQIKAMLLTPLAQALTRNAIAGDGARAYAAMIDRGLLALCESQITSIDISSS